MTGKRPKNRRRKPQFYEMALAEERKSRPDHGRALRLLLRAAVKGDARAKYALGTWYLHGTNLRKNVRKGVQLIREAAKAEVRDALYDLAVSYDLGTGVRRSSRLAFRNYLRAALLGDPAAVYEVGRCYFYGLGCKGDRAVGQVWIERARALGFERK